MRHRRGLVFFHERPTHLGERGVLNLADAFARDAELAALCAQLGMTPDASLDLVAAAVQADALETSGETLPSHLAARLHQWADTTREPVTEKTLIRPRVSIWRIIARNPVNGWLAAAAMLIFALMLTQKEKPLPPERAEQRLRAEAPDLIEREFAGLGDYGQAGGSVIWSDSLQQGYMILDGCPSTIRGRRSINSGSSIPPGTPTLRWTAACSTSRAMVRRRLFRLWRSCR